MKTSVFQAVGPGAMGAMLSRIARSGSILPESPRKHAASRRTPRLRGVSSRDTCVARDPRRRATHRRRPGLTLLEVFISLFIFLVAVTALWQLINVGTEQSLNVKQQAQASMLCQSKLAEVASGATPIEGSSGTFEQQAENQPPWTYTIESQQSDVENLFTVCVTVRCERQDGTTIKSSITQMVLDPKVRGSTLEALSTTSTP